MSLGHRANERPGLGPVVALGLLAPSARVRLGTESTWRQAFLTEGSENMRWSLLRCWKQIKQKGNGLH